MTHNLRTTIHDGRPLAELAAVESKHSVEPLLCAEADLAVERTEPTDEVLHRILQMVGLIDRTP